MYARINISQRKVEGTTDRISMVKVASHSGGMGEIKISFTGRDFGHGGSGGGMGGDYHPKGGDEKLDFKARVLIAFSGMINKIESLFIKSEKIEAASANIGEIEAAIMQSPAYRQGILTGKGFKIWIDNNGDSHIEIDFVDVRKSLKATKLTISEVEIEGGIRMQGAAIMQISEIVDLTARPSTNPELQTNAIRLYFDTKNGKISNQFRIGDMARCHRINLEGSLEVAYCWRVVCGKGDDYIDVYKNNVNTFEKEDLDNIGVMLTVNREVDSGSGMPKENDVVVACGNISDTNRMAYIIEQTIGENAPIREEWSFVNDFRPSKAANLSYYSDATRTEQSADRHVWRTRKGTKPLLLPPEPWMDGTVANYPESYTYDGATFVCMAQGVTETPSKSSNKWMETASKGGQGDKGEQGEQGSKGDYTVQAFRWAESKPARPVGSSPEGWSVGADRGRALTDHSGAALKDEQGNLIVDPYPDSYKLWGSTATFSGATDELVGEWSDTYQVSGESGKPGTTPIIYELVPSATAVKKDTSGVLSPSTVSCRAAVRVGNEREVIGVDDKIEFEGRNLLRNTSRTIERQPGHYGFLASYACQKLVVGQTYIITVEIETGVEPLWILWAGSWGTDQYIQPGVPFLAKREYVELGVHDSHQSNLQLLRFKNISIQAGSSAGAYQPAPEDYAIQLNNAAYTAGTAVTPTDNLNWTLHDPSKPTTAEPIDRKTTVFQEDIEFGGRNLVIKSKKGWILTVITYIIEFLTQDWVVGQTYTITVKGTINTPNWFGLFRDFGQIHVGNLTPIGADIYRLTFVCPAPYAGQPLNSFSLYSYPSQTATLATIEWIKIERGNRATDWSPAPEDVQGEITDAKETAKVEACKDIALKSGYTSWDEMVAAHQREETIIKGGHINTDLIEAEAIVAQSGFIEALKTCEFEAQNATVGRLVVYDDLALPTDQRKVIVGVDPKGVRVGAANIDLGGDYTLTNGDGTGRINITRGDVTPLNTLNGQGSISNISGTADLIKGSSGVLSEIANSRINVPAQNATVKVSGVLSNSSALTASAGYVELWLYCNSTPVGRVFGVGTLGGSGMGIPTNIEATINAASKGTYSLRLKIYPWKGVATGIVSARFSEGKIEWAYMTNENRVQFGRNGATVMRSVSQHFHSSIDDSGQCTTSMAGKNTIAGTTSLTGTTTIIGTVAPPVSGPGNGGIEMRVPKGAAPDMPGVLRAGSVNGNGTSAGAWGYRKAEPKRTEQGKYRITHAIGHTNYYFSGTLIGGFTGAVKIISRQTSYIDVEVRGLDSNLYDCGFDYMICGANYNT